MNQIATVDPNTSTALTPVRKQEIRVVSDPIAVLDTARFEHMQRIANVMAHSNLIPDSLCFEKEENGNKVPLPIEVVTANCFLVVNQAVRWNMDPFAVAQCVSVVHGKLCYEGKLIAAVLEGKLGVELEYEISGVGDAMKVVVTGAVNGKPVTDSKGRPKTIEGTVGEWKTTGRGSPWDARGGHPRMLRYRGAREWGRVYAPGLMLGVYSDDEMEDLSANHRANAARVVNDGPPAPPQVTHQPEIISYADNGLSDAVERAEQAREETAQADAVEWTETEEKTVEAATEQPPAPPLPTGTVKIETAQGGTIVADFPGDRPMTTDRSREIPADGGIPEFLRRQDEPKPETVDVAEWLASLTNAVSGCEDTEQLAAAQNKYQAPMKGKVSKADWARSQIIITEAFQRINKDED
ncbi:hypothetical protein [Bradyrhizobium sp. sGM-13]|uniref:hypothetical protein n=1 Tax=Bradyrhizobium sp. sGM-13 TaxID=2831781 RepID=UPI001BCBDB05|nr:hypothetical protein [Bradyrhizobium sp. sGM-13]